VPAPNADGPDWSRYQTFTGRPFDTRWQLYSNKATEGRSYVDPTFKTRWLQWRDMGLKYRAAYHWLRGDSPMRDQAAHLCRTLDSLGGLQRGEFVQADWETTSNVANVTAAQTIEWCDRIEQHFGRDCIAVYSSDWVPGFTTWRNLKPDVPLWYANYNVGTLTTGGWAECARWNAAIWQWTSSYVHTSVVGRFDMNHVFQWATLDRITDQVAPAPTPTPEPPEDDMAHKVIIEDQLQGGAAFTLDFAPVSPEARAVLVVQGYQVVVQSHPHWTAACQAANGVQAAIMYEKFRDSRDGVAD
jgi:GH25 family lysozyme M1 (1,4-beta-N-acetylmuramidase)